MTAALPDLLTFGAFVLRVAEIAVPLGLIAEGCHLLITSLVSAAVRLWKAAEE